MSILQKLLKHPCGKYLFKVECDFKISNECRGIFESFEPVINATKRRNNNRIICINCSKQLKTSGVNNPNYKHKVNASYFDDIKTVEQAYLLGWIASDGSLAGNTLQIWLNKRDEHILDFFIEQIGDAVKKRKKNTNLIGIYFCSKHLVNKICELLKIKQGAKDRIVQIPTFDSYEQQMAFARGFFEGDGHISKTTRPTCQVIISSYSDNLRNQFNALFNNIAKNDNRNKTLIFFRKQAVFQFLNKIYNIPNLNYKLKRKYEVFQEWKEKEIKKAEKKNTTYQKINWE